MDSPSHILLEMYKAQVSRSEHYENQRATISGLVIIVATALVGLATFDGKLGHVDVVLGILIAAIGSFGLVSSILHYERSLRHGKRAAAYRNELNRLFPESQVNILRAESDRRSATRPGKIQTPDQPVEKKKARLHHLWYALHGGIVTLGLAVAVLAAIGVE